MSYTTIYIHCVWATRKRAPILDAQNRPLLFAHMRSVASQKGIILDAVGGYDDHVHCLFRLSATQSISDVVKQLKGESARWVNEINLLGVPLRWATGYYAASIAEASVKAVRLYIQRQPEHHGQPGFTEDYLRHL